MKTYHKIQTLFNRDPNNLKHLIFGDYAKDEFRVLSGNLWECTEKIDGTNIRVIWDGENVEFRGKTDQAQIPPMLLTYLTETFTPEKMMKVFPGVPVTLYGEGYGKKIQKCGGKYISGGNGFILFDVFINDLWLRRTGVTDIAHHLDIPVVPVIGILPLLKAVELVSNGFQSKVSEQPMTAEGLILKPLGDLLDRRGNRIFTKLKYKDFN